MNRKFGKILGFLNKVLYIGSAAMLIAGALLTAFPQTVSADKPVTTPEMQLNLSHIYCADEQIEVHFVLLNAPDGVTPGSVTFSLKINDGAAVTHTVAPTIPNTGNVWHYFYYGTTNGYYNVTSASVLVGGTTVTLHNPGVYSDTNNVCSIDDTCDDETADNYGDIGECTYTTCDDTAANNYGEVGTCTYDSCDDTTANNFGEVGECTYDSCDDEDANNFGEIGECTYDTCDDDAANNFGEIGACTYDTCNDEDANNFGEVGECTYDTCDDEDANNFGEVGECTYDTCDDDAANNFGEIGECTYDTCDDDAANNFGEIGECTYDTCADTTANNFGEVGECTYDTCDDEAANNYGEIGECAYTTCTDEKATNFGKVGECTYTNTGCKDPKATNYNPDAETADNSLCKYKKIELPDPLKVAVDPYCNADGEMVWTVINPNNVNVTMTHFIVDGESRNGFSVTPGEHFLTTTPIGTHTVEIHFNEMATTSLTWTIKVCPLPIPVTGAEVLIPVTGADETANLGMGLSFGGLSVVGLALLLSALRKMYHL